MIGGLPAHNSPAHVWCHSCHKPVTTSFHSEDTKKLTRIPVSLLRGDHGNHKQSERTVFHVIPHIRASTLPIQGFSPSSICLVFPSPPHSIPLIIPLFESLTVEIIYLTQIRLIINPSSPSRVWFASEVCLCLRVIKNAWVSDSVSGPIAASRSVVNYLTCNVLISGIISDASLIIFRKKKQPKQT